MNGFLATGVVFIFATYILGIASNFEAAKFGYAVGFALGLVGMAVDIIRKSKSHGWSYWHILAFIGFFVASSSILVNLVGVYRGDLLEVAFKLGVILFATGLFLPALLTFYR